MAASGSNDGVNRAQLLRQLEALLQGGEAHTPFSAAVAGFPAELRGTVPERLPYSAWQLVEHIRIAQRDIVEFSAPPQGRYKPLQWPNDYWPKSPEPPGPSAWDASIASIEEDAKRFQALLGDDNADLTEPFPWGEGQNLLREALLLADHLSYHTGELVVLRRLLGIWPPRPA